ncbi:MAG: hypothetical protein ACE5KH_04125 [Candidatus Geothermarchaeales archaeon]
MSVSLFSLLDRGKTGKVFERGLLQADVGSGVDTKLADRRGSGWDYQVE